MVTIGTALVLIAVGAILKWAVTAHVSGIDLATAGTVLFVIGLVALVLSIVYTFWWASRTNDQDPGATRRPPGAY